MLATLLPDFETSLVEIREIAPAGFVLAFGIDFNGPAFLHDEFNKTWRTHYEKSSYFTVDPVFLWGVSQIGKTRWSEINLPDVRGVMKEAAEFGMRFGVVCSVKKGAKRSMLTASRSDREMTDSEISYLAAKFETWSALVFEEPSLTQGERDVLAHLRDGLGQRDIATTLIISESTVKQRALSACRKLGAKTRAQAVATAIKRDLL